MAAVRMDSALGALLLAADEVGITGIWFVGQKYFPQNLRLTDPTPPLEEAKRWLALYFSGVEPDFTPALHLTGTAFQLSVWALLQKIPYGQTVTYGALAKRLGCGSAQAVGGAVGRNPVSVIVPCHRVLGADGGLTGYAGGLEKKEALLRLERQGKAKSSPWPASHDIT